MHFCFLTNASIFASAMKHYTSLFLIFIMCVSIPVSTYVQMMGGAMYEIKTDDTEDGDETNIWEQEKEFCVCKHNLPSVYAPPLEEGKSLPLPQNELMRSQSYTLLPERPPRV